MAAQQIAEALIAGKTPRATRKQAIDLQAATLSALRKRKGGMVVVEGAPARCQLRRSQTSSFFGAFFFDPGSHIPVLIML